MKEISTFGDLYREFIHVKEQLNGMEFPLTIDDKQVEKVELLDNPIRLEITTKTQWVNVKEQLPQVGISVLVLTSNSKVSISKRYQPKDCKGNNIGTVMWRGSFTFQNSIIAWMPIPSFDDILQVNKDVLKRLKDK